MKRGAGWVNCSIFLLGAIFIVRASAQSDPCLGLTASFNPNSNTVDLRFGGEVGVAYTIESSADLQTWIPVRTNNGPANPNPLHIDASADQAFYRVSRPLLPIFSYVLTTKSTLQFQGNNVYVDSYDSADPVYSTNGSYDPGKRKAGGDIGVGTVANVANATIKGKVYVAPSGSIAVGPSGSIGNLSWVGPGVQAGWFLNDFNYCLPDVAVPFTSGLAPIKLASGTNTYVLGNFAYFVSGDFALLANQTLYVAGNARLYVSGNFTMQSPASYLTLAPGATLKVYVGTPAGPGVSCTLSRITNPGNPLNFQFYGLPSNTTVTWLANSSALGVGYAPRAALLLSGSSGTNDFQGALVANSMTVNGYFQFHFDENLKRNGPTR